MSTLRNVVLVHGGFVDGSGWQRVYNVLTGHGYHVSVYMVMLMLCSGGDAQ